MKGNAFIVINFFAQISILTGYLFNPVSLFDYVSNSNWKLQTYILDFWLGLILNVISHYIWNKFYEVFVLVVGMLGVQLRINHESYTKRTEKFARVRSTRANFVLLVHDE